MAKVRDATAPDLPLLVIRPEFSEQVMQEKIWHWARVTRCTLSNPARVHAVCARELKAFRMERALQ